DETFHCPLVREGKDEFQVLRRSGHGDVDGPGEIALAPRIIVQEWRRDHLHRGHPAVLKQRDLFAFRRFELGRVDIADVPLDFEAEARSPMAPTETAESKARDPVTHLVERSVGDTWSLL